MSEAGADIRIPETFPPPSILTWNHRHILDLDDFNKEEIQLVFEIANAMEEVLSREVKQVPTLRGKTIVNMFYEPSTRTRASFELAAKYLSANTINLDAAKSSVAKGESLIDNLRTLKSLGADVIVIRHHQAGAPYLASRHVNASIVNAGDGSHAHPTQALLDMYTIHRRLGDIDGLKVAIIGDILHSRVARSNIWGMSRMGANVVLCGPPTLLPLHLSEFLARNELKNVRFTTKLESALEDADIVMVLRLQLERQQSGLLPSFREYIRYYQINEEMVSRARTNVLIMHPGPINEGLEISPDVAHGIQSIIEEQVTNGVAIRMALFYLIMGGRPDNAV
jgi:aspartate carbamoyltransferase catalytic subunit